MHPIGSFKNPLNTPHMCMYIQKCALFGAKRDIVYTRILCNSNLMPFYVSPVSCKLSILTIPTINKSKTNKNTKQPVRMW